MRITPGTAETSTFSSVEVGCASLSTSAYAIAHEYESSSSASSSSNDGGRGGLVSPPKRMPSRFFATRTGAPLLAREAPALRWKRDGRERRRYARGMFATASAMTVVGVNWRGSECCQNICERPGLFLTTTRFLSKPAKLETDRDGVRPEKRQKV